MFTAGLAALVALQTSCRENEYGTVDLTMPDDNPTYEPVTGEYVYQHPCIMFSQEDFNHVKQSLDDGTAPQAVKDEFEQLKNSTFAQLTYLAQPQTCIVRGDDKGSLSMMAPTRRWKTTPTPCAMPASPTSRHCSTS